MHDLGGDTRDHITLGTPHPQEHGLPTSDRETRIRRTGTRSTWAGTLLLVGDTTTALALMAYGRHHTWDDPVTRQFVGLIIILIGLGATALITSGLIERQQRQQRTLIRRAMARADANAGLGDANQTAIEKNTKILADLVYGLHYTQKDIAELGTRLTALEAAFGKLPDYGTIVADGYRLGRHSAGLGDLDQLGDPSAPGGPNGWPSTTG
jgi:hypothetical protein